MQSLTILNYSLYYNTIYLTVSWSVRLLIHCLDKTLVVWWEWRQGGMEVLVFVSSLLSTPNNHTSGLGTHPLESVSPSEDARRTLTPPSLTYGSTVQGSRVKTNALLPKNLSIFTHLYIFIHDSAFVSLQHIPVFTGLQSITVYWWIIKTYDTVDWSPCQPPNPFLL